MWTAATRHRTFSLPCRGRVPPPGRGGRQQKISLKIMTLKARHRQKINDCLGNPVEIGIAVCGRWWTQLRHSTCWTITRNICPSSATAHLRNIVRIYPYDVAQRGHHRQVADRGSSLRGSSEITKWPPGVRDEIQRKVADVGLEDRSAHHSSGLRAGDRAVMLQCQASAIIDAQDDRGRRGRHGRNGVDSRRGRGIHPGRGTQGGMVLTCWWI